MVSTSTKTKLGAKGVKVLAKNPRLLRMAPPVAGAGWKLAKPIAKRRARKRAQRFGETAREIAVTVATYAPELARATGVVTPPKRKRLAPHVGARVSIGTGAVLGAAAVYFLEPGHGREHRRRLRRFVK